MGDKELENKELEKEVIETIEPTETATQKKTRLAKEKKEAKALAKAEKEEADRLAKEAEKEKMKAELEAELEVELRAKIEKENKEKTLEGELSSAVKSARETGVTKNIKRVFDDEDLVPVMNIATGNTNIKNQIKPFDHTIYEKMGDVRQVRFGTLAHLRAKKSDCFKTMLYILDDEVVKELGLTKIYDGFGKIERILSILSEDLKIALPYVKNANKEVRNIVGQLLMDKIQRKESIDFFKVKALADELQLDIDMERVKEEE